jgi:hypothetical protein
MGPGPGLQQLIGIDVHGDGDLFAKWQFVEFAEETACNPLLLKLRRDKEVTRR